MEHEMRLKSFTQLMQNDLTTWIAELDALILKADNIRELFHKTMDEIKWFSMEVEKSLKRFRNTWSGNEIHFYFGVCHIFKYLMVAKVFGELATLIMEILEVHEETIDTLMKRLLLGQKMINNFITAVYELHKEPVWDDKMVEDFLKPIEKKWDDLRSTTSISELQTTSDECYEERHSGTPTFKERGI